MCYQCVHGEKKTLRKNEYSSVKCVSNAVSGFKGLTSEITRHRFVLFSRQGLALGNT